MNIGSVMPYQPPTPVESRTDAPDSSASDDKTSSSDDTTAATQFSAILALLAGNGHRVRVNFAQKPNDGDLALLDRLLNSGLVANESDTGANAGELSPASGQISPELASLVVNATRYSMLNDLASKVTADTPSSNTTSRNSKNDIAQLIAAKNSNGKNSDAVIAGLARALNSGRLNARASSAEEMIARGDIRTAKTRAIVDTVLNSAGTPEGAAIAGSSDALAALGITAQQMAGFLTALEAARTASAANPDTPVNDANALMPELRAKLDRVIERMQSEYGHDVQIVETARSSERQEQLFAQGRTTPGSVVTWTHDSAHIHGAAADVVVDGSWNNTKGFQRLQQIAKEEGLKTLGMKDPGHLELMNSDDVADALSNTTVRNARAFTSAASNNSAAGIARVANVAGVAGIARVAVAGQSTHTHDVSNLVTQQDRNVANISLGALAESANNGSAGDSLGDAKREQERDNARAGVRERSRDSKSMSSRDGAFPAYGDSQNAPRTNSPSANAVERPNAAAGAHSAERVQQANDLRDNAPAKAVSQVTLDVDGPNGTQRITVDARGNVVNTHISTDASSADHMRANVDELKGALEQHGLQSEAVRITVPSASRTVDSAEQVKQAATQGERDALRLAGANSSNANDGTSQQGMRDRAGSARDWEKHNDARNARDGQRQGNEQRNRRGPNYEEL